MNQGSISAIASVAYKEFLHIYRDRRVLILLLILPPVFTLVFGHAFETSEMTNVPARLINRDGTPRAQRFIDLIMKNKTFDWKVESDTAAREEDLLAHGVQAALIVPQSVLLGLTFPLMSSAVLRISRHRDVGE